MKAGARKDLFVIAVTPYQGGQLSGPIRCPFDTKRYGGWGSVKVCVVETYATSYFSDLWAALTIKLVVKKWHEIIRTNKDGGGGIYPSGPDD